MHRSSCPLNRLWNISRFRLLAIVIILLLIMLVRLYYYAGPIFANSPEDGLFLDLFANAVLHNAPISFTAYRNITWGNYSNPIFGTTGILDFYGGFIWPEIFILDVFGFSASAAIGYIILTSMIEGLFIVLITEHLYDIKAGIIGGILFAFFPVDVLFSTQIHPLVPAMAFLSGSFYFFLLGLDTNKNNRKATYYVISGLLAGLSYITNPLGLAFILFVVVYLFLIFVRSVLRKNWSFDYYALLIFAGFILGFSFTGVLYFAQAGNFFLYPLYDHGVFMWQVTPANYGGGATDYTLFGIITLEYVYGSPTYFPVLFFRIFPDYIMPLPDYNISYFALTFYAAITFSAVLLLKRFKIKHTYMLVGFFVFCVWLINLFPSNISFHDGTIDFLLITMIPYLATLLTLPITVISALALAAILDIGPKKRKNKLTGILKSAPTLAVIILLGAIMLTDVYALNFDIAYYRASMATVNYLVAFATRHPSSMIYANPIMAGEANYIDGFKRINATALQINYLYNTSFAYLSGIRNAYIAVGGSLSLETSPAVTENFASAVEGNLTDSEPIVNYSNPLGQYWGSKLAPRLVIYYRK